jgi:hypothetical protein
LEELFLVCCSSSVRDVSLAVEKLEKLKTRKIFGVDLAVVGDGFDAWIGVACCFLASRILTMVDTTS